MDYVALWAAAWPYITAIVAAASALDATLPQPAPGSHWLIVRKVVSFLAVNVANASNGRQPAFATWIVRIAQPILSGREPVSAKAPPPAAASPQTPAAPVTAVLLALGLASLAGACATKAAATDVFELRAGYDATVLAPMAGYARLPPCLSHVAPAQGAPVCSDPAVVDQLRKADSAAKAALDAAEETVRQHPTMDATAAIAAAENAVAAVKVILTTYNIH